MARTEIRGGDQILNNTILREDLVLDFLGSTDWDITNGALNATIKGLREATAADEVVVKSQLDALAALVGNPMRYKGAFDAATPSPDLDTLDNLVGDTYKVTVAGTYLGIELAVNDTIILNKDVPSGTTLVAADIDKIDNTESPDLIRESDVVDNLTSTGVITAPLSANQGYVIKGLIDALSANVKLRKYGEELATTHNSPVLPALAQTPVAGTVQVFLNGLRQLEGSGNDFTITGQVISFEYNLKNNDQVQCDYEY